MNRRAVDFVDAVRRGVVQAPWGWQIRSTCHAVTCNRDPPSRCMARRLPPGKDPTKQAGGEVA
jgi:hypothetical protein